MQYICDETYNKNYGIESIFIQIITKEIYTRNEENRAFILFSFFIQNIEFLKYLNHLNSFLVIEMISEEEKLLHDTRDIYQRTKSYFLYDHKDVSSN